jgi:RimJ/RimL family protein N-acetyltransferase
MSKKKLPKQIREGDIVLVKISLKEDNIIGELLTLYKNNREHLSYWHHGWNELIFNNIDELKMHLKKNRLLCYIIYDLDKIIGCIEVGRLFTDEEKMKHRILTYWIDKDNVRKGIIYKSLKKFEKIFINQELNVLITEVDVGNIPSINLMRKLEYQLISISFQISGNEETICKFYTFRKSLMNKQ